jgi:hypothetical protein
LDPGWRFSEDDWFTIEPDGYVGTMMNAATDQPVVSYVPHLYKRDGDTWKYLGRRT